MCSATSVWAYTGEGISAGTTLPSRTSVSWSVRCLETTWYVCTSFMLHRSASHLGPGRAQRHLFDAPAYRLSRGTRRRPRLLASSTDRGAAMDHQPGVHPPRVGAQPKDAPASRPSRSSFDQRKGDGNIVDQRSTHHVADDSRSPLGQRANRPSARVPARRGPRRDRDQLRPASHPRVGAQSRSQGGCGRIPCRGRG